MSTFHDNTTLGRLRGALWIIGFASLGFTESHRWITGVLLLGALAWELVAGSPDPEVTRDYEEPAGSLRGSPRRSQNAPLPTGLSIVVVLVAVAVFARLFGDRNPWSFYVFIVGVGVLVLCWGWGWGHRLGARSHQDELREGRGRDRRREGD